MEKVILVDMEPGCHDFPCSSSGFEPWNAMFQFSRGIPFFLSYSRDITNIALSFPYVPLMFFFFIIRERQYGLLLQCFKVVFHLAKGRVLINLPILSSRGLLT